MTGQAAWNAPNIEERVARLYGAQALFSLRQAKVCVIGLGGVGSWAVEALARSGIGHLQLIDPDQIIESNVNRQLQALESNFGKSKATSLAERIAQINPTTTVAPIETFIEPANLDSLLHSNWDWIIDCIDQLHNKAALIAYCKQQQLNVVSVGGAGGRRDPSQVLVADLSRTTHDPLLSKLRTQLRRNYGFSRNLNQEFGVPCVFSTETLSIKTAEKRNGYGTIVTVTATYGFMAASVVINQLAAAT
ncbi:hypothetical protein TI03_04610 [Achromatium sp. WMS1]|nr:hypothetical protein TI03_04610 [Achromatium sp. WMS1]